MLIAIVGLALFIVLLFILQNQYHRMILGLALILFPLAFIVLGGIPFLVVRIGGNQGHAFGFAFILNVVILLGALSLIIGLIQFIYNSFKAKKV
ncbi:hypothetical protein [Aureibacillus halotolerans]|uniref:YesK-like protein n=1 Tax=Aureibacillus halotolerans TaxID=1508390 RepID=A0A4R6TLE4_9BACI|nr:hypothetical protein [Aureibacillus halotolerans]TDQ32174.1 hypothetical protein EV213_13220 [Aureibacillus halotolerans]